MPEITLKYGLSNLIHYSPADEMNRRENTIIAIVMKLIAEDERGYTSAKYLSEHITDLGFQKTKQSILPYIELAKSLGILENRTHKFIFQGLIFFIYCYVNYFFQDIIAALLSLTQI